MGEGSEETVVHLAVDGIQSGLQVVDWLAYVQNFSLLLDVVVEADVGAGGRRGPCGSPCRRYCSV